MNVNFLIFYKTCRNMLYRYDEGYCMKKNNMKVSSAMQRKLLGLMLSACIFVVPVIAEPIYTLTPIDNWDGDTVIGKTVYDIETGKYDYLLYRVDFNKTTFGEGDTESYFEWENYSLYQVDTPTEGKLTFIVKGDSLPTIGNLNNYRVGYDENIDSIVSDFILNEGAISNWGGNIGTISGDFVGNYGSTITNSGDIKEINGNFIMNQGYQGAIFNDRGARIDNINANFIGNDNYHGYNPGGAISNFGTIGKISGRFEDNISYRGAGAIFNSKQDGAAMPIELDYNPEEALPKTEPLEIVNSQFINNGAITQGGGMVAKLSLEDEYYDLPDKAYGGAIYTTDDLKITADNGITEFTGNYVVDSNNQVENQAIFVENKVQWPEPADLESDDLYWCNHDKQTTLTISAKNNGKVIINDKIAGSVTNLNPYWNDGDTIYQYDKNGNILPKDEYKFGSYKLEIKGDESGVVQLNNDIVSDGIYYYYNSKLGDLEENSIVAEEEVSQDHYLIKATGAVDVSLESVTLHLSARDNVLDNNNLTLNSGTLNMINNIAGTAALNSLTVAGNTNMLVDVDLANSQMDRITAKEYGKHNGNIVVKGMNLLSDAKEDHTEILFAEKGLKNNVQSDLNETNKTYQTTAYTPIYKYGVTYDNREDAGYFLFDRAGAYSSNKSDSFNPAVLSSSTSAQAGTQSALNETVRFAFQHMDSFSQMPSFQRMAILNQNKYAIQDVEPKYNSNFEQLDKGYWVRPFTTFESINLHNGPSVDAITYGTLIGFDGTFRELKRDWYNVQSVYAGYIGSQMSYSGVDTSLNGGVLGLTETFYKGNFFGALTATAGSSNADSSTMYGKEDFTSILGGIGAKTGYNFEFENGKYILQPIMFMNYAFVNTFDYTNSAKVKVESDPMHSIQINPQVKFIANLDRGWQPYASVGFVWNVWNSSKVRANNVVLPSMSVNPYVEYGLGVQRYWKDSLTGFAQAMVRNGGRNGVALTFGFRYALGKEAENL